MKYVTLVALAAAIGAGLYYYNHVNNEIRQRVLERLAAHYAGLVVEVRSALLVDGEGIEIRGVRISDPRLSGPAAELAYFDEIVLTCRTELAEFLRGEPQIEHIRVRRPRIRATRLADGRWSAARLLPCPKFSKHHVEMVIENGTVELIDATRHNSPTFTLREINVVLQPLLAEHADGDEPLHLAGTLTGDYFQRAELSGRLEPHDAGFRLEGAIERLDVSPEFREALPAELADRFAAIASLRATCELGFALVHQPGQEEPWTFSVDGHVSRGRYDDVRLPQALTELAGEFYADNRGLLLKSLTGRFGQSSFRCFVQLHGWSAGSPLFVEVAAEQLLVGRAWEAMLGEDLLEHWRKFQPAGEVDAHVKLWYDAGRWRPNVRVDCRNVSFTYFKFPYRVDRSRGTITLDDDHLSLNLVAQAAGRDIRIKGEVDNPGPDFTGIVEISGSDLAVEPRILDALQPKPREIVQSLNPAGAFDFYTSISRDTDEERPHQVIQLVLKHGSVRYDKFPYPINNIRGSVQMQDGVWWANSLEGTNDSGRIVCNARLEPTREGPLLTLHFAAQEIALEDELRDALPPHAQQAWRDLRPRGSVDLRADVRYIAGTMKPETRVRVYRFGEGASIEPVHFPYRIEGLRGGGGEQPAFLYDSSSNRVDFVQLRGVHGRTKLSATGFCQFEDHGAWRLHFDRLTADRLRADSDLLAALPAGLKKVVTQLKPTGVINLDGSFDLSANGVPGEPLRSSWNLDFNVLQSSIEAGVLLENVSGTLRLEGQHDGRQLRSTGELLLDSLTFKDFQFTDVRGPLWIDDVQVVFGSQARRPQPNVVGRRMTARLYGGTMLADVWVGMNDPARYVIQATLTDGDLERFAREQLAGKQRLKGKVGAGLVLGGTGAGLHAMEGQGGVWLREADIYDLPVMVQLLKILSIRLPDKTGFTMSDVEFDIAGEHINLKKIEFAGDAISLLGKGEMNLNSDIRAALSAIVGRSDWQLPVFKSVMGQASEQIMQIRVDGNLADPHIRREAFPGINQALQQLQAEMQPRVQPAPLPQTPPPQAARTAAGRR